jgi:hypothetical protein
MDTHTYTTIAGTQVCLAVQKTNKQPPMAAVPTSLHGTGCLHAVLCKLQSPEGSKFHVAVQCIFFKESGGVSHVELDLFPSVAPHTPQFDVFGCSLYVVCR